MKTQATGETAVKPIKTSKQTVKQAIPKSKSMSAINKKTTPLQQQQLEITTCPAAPKEPQKTCTTTDHEDPQELPSPTDTKETKSAASVKPVQKVTPMVKGITTAPENSQENSVILQGSFDETAEMNSMFQEPSTMSGSLFDELAAVHQGGVSSLVGNQSGLKDPSAHTDVRIEKDALVDDKRYNQDETKENSSLQVGY